MKEKQEERCNGCGNHSEQGNRENKGSESEVKIYENRDKEGKLSIVLVATLLVCCALPAILASTGVGIVAYSFLKGWNLILVITSILFLIFGGFAFYHWRRRTKTLTATEEYEISGPELTSKKKKDED